MANLMKDDNAVSLTWRPFLKRLDNLFNDFMENRDIDMFSPMPNYSLEKEGEHYRLNIDLPGIRQEDIKLEYEKGCLHVSGSSSLKSSGRDAHDTWKEKSNRSFQANFTIPPEVRLEQIEARYEDGVLSLRIPRESTEKRKVIPINSEKKSLDGSPRNAAH